ncbi:hypothetical protein ACN1NW_000436 [Acinetobacter baumannii]|nr:hypothetical protein [Acinetobacter baumannii]ELA7031020.1 hypothetical protein [Acinetobacter baumannii]ELA7118783.1 hypothetical protein [Acinetobacter baumannii]ELB0919732.1 hypothetical protein [Acinetobacter baumannii]ELB0965909.1 hypothetical protein [Acinetobacter baumannii]
MKACIDQSLFSDFNKPHIVYMSMTPREEFRLNGCLCVQTQQRLIDRIEDLETEAVDKSAIKAYLREIKGNLIDSDDLKCLSEELFALQGHLRGENRKRMTEVLQAFTHLRHAVEGQSEYACEQIKHVVEELKLAK